MVKHLRDKEPVTTPPYLGLAPIEMEKRQVAIGNGELRARARSRCSEVIAQFDEVNKLVAESTRTVFGPWLKMMIDVRTILESDLNPGAWRCLL